MLPFGSIRKLLANQISSQVTVRIMSSPYDTCANKRRFLPTFVGIPFRLYQHSRGAALKCSSPPQVHSSPKPAFTISQPTMTANPALSAISPQHRELIINLHAINALKFGSFTLKSGIISPIYVDLRVTVSHPHILSNIASTLLQTVQSVSYDRLCGVPYTALPFATAMSISSQTPMVMRRKEAKNYGTKQLIEGSWSPNDKCLIVEDLVTSGLSVMETVAPLLSSGMTVSDVVVLLDRQQGARQNLSDNGLTLHSVFTMSQMLDVLVDAGKIGDATRNSVNEFIAQNQVSNVAKKTPVKDTALTYTQRAEKILNPVAQRLLRLMDSKKTNLAVAADVTSVAELCDLAEAVGPYICLLKTHADVVTDWDSKSGPALAEIAKRHGFLLFEDRKFADIGNTVMHQLNGGVHTISAWADIVNAHSVPGPGIVKGLTRAAETSGQQLALLLLAEMSSEGNMPAALPEYTKKTVKMAEDAQKQEGAIVCGFISMGKIAGDEFLYMTPGVQLASSGDGLGQQYATPESVIAEKGSDVIIVGRGVYKAADQAAAAKTYREEGWMAYQKRCSALL